MKDFKKCIWLVPNEDHPWNGMTNGVPVHMTIYSGLNTIPNDMFSYFKGSKNLQFFIRIREPIYQTKSEDFFGLQFSAELTDPQEKPEWWPLDPHISFSYKYSPFFPEEINLIKTKLIEYNACLTSIKFMNCSGHYNTWSEII